jgi:uncharacterized protein (TIGR01777 family)
MDIAITGSGGLIGKALVSALQARGDRILSLTRSTDRAHTDDDAIFWSPHDGEIDTAGLDGIDAVIHLAGEPIAEKRWTDAQKRELLTSRTDGTTLISKTLAGLARPPQTLLSASAIGYYGDTGQNLVDESSPPGTDFLADICVAWEAATGAAEDAGIRTAHLRTGIVQSTHGGALAKQLLPFKLGLGGKVLPGTQWISWITIDDEVGAILHALDTPEVSGPVNLVAPNPVTNADYASTLGKVLHRPTFIIPLIGPKLLFGSELAESLLKTSQRVSDGVLSATGYKFAHTNLADALRSIIGTGG